MPIRFLLAFMLTLATAAAAAPGRHDSGAPIDLSAAHSELQDRENRTIFWGNVVVRQAEMTLATDRLTVSYAGRITDGTPEISRIDATGGVVLTRPDQTARSDYAVYDLNRHLVTMIGGVVLRQGKGNVVNGARLTIDLDNDRATIDGSAVGGGPAQPGSATPGGRVTGHFLPPKHDSPNPQ